MFYFKQEAHNTAIRVSERNKLQEFYDELVDPSFQLYISTSLKDAYQASTPSYKRTTMTYLQHTKKFF